MLGNSPARSQTILRSSAGRALLTVKRCSTSNAALSAAVTCCAAISSKACNSDSDQVLHRSLPASGTCPRSRSLPSESDFTDMPVLVFFVLELSASALRLRSFGACSVS